VSRKNIFNGRLMADFLRNHLSPIHLREYMGLNGYNDGCMGLNREKESLIKPLILTRQFIYRAAGTSLFPAFMSYTPASRPPGLHAPSVQGILPTSPSCRTPYVFSVFLFLSPVSLLKMKKGTSLSSLP
jgi:hypothetical protein